MTEAQYHLKRAKFLRDIMKFAPGVVSRMLAKNLNIDQTAASDEIVSQCVNTETDGGLEICIVMNAAETMEDATMKEIELAIHAIDDDVDEWFNTKMLSTLPRGTRFRK